MDQGMLGGVGKRKRLARKRNGIQEDSLTEGRPNKRNRNYLKENRNGLIEWRDVRETHMKEGKRVGMNG